MKAKIRKFFFLFILGVAMAETVPVQGAEIWRVRLKDAAAWEAAPAWVNADFLATDSDCTVSPESNLVFRVGGTSKAMKWLLNSPQELKSGKYIVVRYRATALDPNSADYVLYFGGQEGSELLSVPMKQLDVDSKWHTAAFPVSSGGRTTAIAVHVFTGPTASVGKLELEYIALADAPPPEAVKKK